MLIEIATFPGIIVHEMAHALFCRILGVRILKVCYFKFGNPAGYVLHDTPDSIFKQFLISTGPLFINTIFGAIIAFPGALGLLKLQISNPIEYFLLWLGISVAMHAFPSTGDAKSFLHSIWFHKAPVFLKLLITPIALLIYIGALGSMFWLDIIYGVGVVLLFPKLLLLILK